jgi:lipopolysaccharide transport system permease protein
VVPIASVLANCLHLLIQIGVLFTFTLVSGYGVNRYWLWLPLVWGFEVLFVLGLVLACSALDVYLRDMRYVVESANTILFYLVPIFYGFESIPLKFQGVYGLNPVSALVLALRNILMNAEPPGTILMWKLGLGSLATLMVGWTIFRALERRFYDHL